MKRIICLEGGPVGLYSAILPRKASALAHTRHGQFQIHAFQFSTAVIPDVASA